MFAGIGTVTSDKIWIILWLRYFDTYMFWISLQYLRFNYPSPPKSLDMIIFVALLGGLTKKRWVLRERIFFKLLQWFESQTCIVLYFIENDTTKLTINDLISFCRAFSKKKPVAIKTILAPFGFEKINIIKTKNTIL